MGLQPCVPGVVAIVWRARAPPRAGRCEAELGREDLSVEIVLARHRRRVVGGQQPEAWRVAVPATVGDARLQPVATPEPPALVTPEPGPGGGGGRGGGGHGGRAPAEDLVAQAEGVLGEEARLRVGGLALGGELRQGVHLGLGLPTQRAEEVELRNVPRGTARHVSRDARMHACRHAGTQGGTQGRRDAGTHAGTQGRREASTQGRREASEQGDT